MSKTYTPEERERLATAIVKAVETTSTPKACKAAGVPVSTFKGWMGDNQQFDDAYARARSMYLEQLADEILELSDEKIPFNDKGSTDHGLVQQRKNQVDARKWLLSKLKPKKYGDRLTLAGDDDQPLIVGKVECVIVDKKEGDDG